MHRRSFLKTSALATSGTLLVPQFLQSCTPAVANNQGQRKLVVIQLSGGNDGLNTIIPFNNDIYYQQRPQLAIPKNEVIRLTDELGLHPSLQPLQRLYDQGWLGIYNAVGYPNPVRSHFRATDIWQTASGANQFWTTGWIGRYLDAQCKAHKCSAHHAIEVDDTLSLTLKGKDVKGLAVQKPKKLYQALQKQTLQTAIHHQNAAKHHDNHPNVAYLYKTLVETNASAQYIYEQAKISRHTTDYPKNPLGRQLKTVAQMMASGLDTQIYYVSFSGFDTHANQLNQHARLLKVYADSASVFMEDLQRSGLLNDTLVMTFSEFGRRVTQNASRGTDHGTANQVFLMGGNLKRQGFYNAAPNLAQLDERGDIRFQLDFRNIYATILKQWLGVNDQAILQERFRYLDFV